MGPSTPSGHIIRTLVIIVVFALLILLVLCLGQRRLIYLPSGDLPPPPNDVDTVAITTEDGIELSLWIVGTEANPLATIVVFNGNAGNRSDRLPLARSLTTAGFDVVLFDYRGYGDSPGSPSQTGLESDARAVGQYVHSRSDRPVIYFGESLGAAVAVGLATERALDGLVLRSPFTSLADVGQAHYPFLPVGLLLRDRWEVVEPLEKLDVPVLVIAGDHDSIVPISQSREVYEAAPTPKDLVVVEGANHNDPELTGGPGIGQAINAFFAEHLGR